MLLKSKFQTFYNTFERRFLRTFFLSFAVVLFVIPLFNLRFTPVSNSLFLYSGFISSFLFFFLRFKKLNEKSATRKYILEFLSPIFLMALFMLSISNLPFLEKYDLSPIKNIHPILILISIFSGFILFYANRNKIETEIENEHAAEQEAEQKRSAEFSEKFPKINKILIFRSITKWCYKEGWGYSLVIILILSFFVGLRFPYLNLSFTGTHNMKYAAYIEPAKHMLENGLLWNQLKYQADPIVLPEGKFDTFGQYPLIEWGVVAVNKIFPFYSMEFNTRVFMTLLGVILLLLIYQFLKEFLVKKQILLIILLLSSNVIFQFFTYVTVLDPINLIFLFSSLILLISGIKKDDPKKLFLSGIIAGIGISVKIHTIIFCFPIFFLFLFFYKKIREEKRISYLFIIFPNFLLQTILFRISFRYLPRNFALYLSIFILLIIIQVYIYRKIAVISDNFERIFKERIRLFYSLIGLGLITIVCLVFTLDWIRALLKDFVTDKYLIFNWNMYTTFLNRYKEWVTPFVYYFSPFLLYIIFLSKNKKIKLLIYSFTISSFVYLVLTSKVVYFHEYYNHIIVISFIFLFSFIYYLTKLNKSLFSKIFIKLILLLLIIIISHQSIKQIDAKLSIEKPEMKTVSEYLYKNLKEDQFFIYSADISTAIGFYSNRYSLTETLSLDYDKELVDLIKKDLKNNIPFGQVMQKYKISLYLTQHSPKSKNNDFSYLFSSKKTTSDQKTSERTTLILCVENDICTSNDRFLDEAGFYVFEKNIKPYLRLIQKIDNYYVYRFE